MTHAYLLRSAPRCRRCGRRPDSTRCDSRLCDRALNTAAQPSARADLDRALATAVSAQQTARAAFLRGCQLFSERKPDKADDEFEKAVKLEDGNAVYHFWLGRAVGDQAEDANPLRQPGLARRTKAEFERAADLAPDYLDAREGLVEYYLAAPGILGGSKDKARAEAAEIAKRNAFRGGRSPHDRAADQRYDRGHPGTSADRAHPDSVVCMVRSRRCWIATPLERRVEDDRPSERPSPDWQPTYAFGHGGGIGERLDQGRPPFAVPDHKRKPAALARSAHWRLGMSRRSAGIAPVRDWSTSALALDPNLKAPRMASHA